ncbi:hypothetical protein [Pelagibius sp.]|uniref:hypothetical protein n=1 Tax=Pelagibius sp. TaxID=1931238 RepID=UPI00262B3BD9|nr:hypothetical protein [Pelagibius sp.]
MSRLLKMTLLALTAAAPLVTGVLSGPALAASGGMKNVSFSATPVGDPPTLVFQEKNGKYVLGKGGPKATIKFRVKGEKRGRFRIVSYHLFNETSNNRITLVRNFSVKKLDKTIMHEIKPAELQSYADHGRKICEDEGDLQQEIRKTIKPGLTYRLDLQALIKQIGRDASSYRSAHASVPVRIICKPEPLRVIDADLSVTFDGSPLSCPVKATLKAKFKTNKPGTFKFNLYRGDGEFQTVTRTAGESKTVTFTKHYTFKKPTNRKYLVATIPSGASSGWVPMRVNCNNKTDGFQTAPKPNSNY